MKYNKRLEIRVTENDKKMLDLILNDINKNSNKKHGYRFLIMQYAKAYLNNNNIGLELEKEQLIKANEEINIEKKKLIEKEQENNIKIKAIDNKLNNKTIFNISNYPNHEKLNHAFNRLHEIVLKNNIMSFELIKDDLEQLEQVFKINEDNLLKNVVLNHFPEWQNELLLKENEQENENKDINKLFNKFERQFKSQKIYNKPIDFYNSEKDKWETILNKKDININEFETLINNKKISNEFKK